MALGLTDCAYYLGPQLSLIKKFQKHIWLREHLVTSHLSWSKKYERWIQFNYSSLHDLLPQLSNQYIW